MNRDLPILAVDTRLEGAELAAQVRAWSDCRESTALLDAVTQVVVVLNQQRQIVFANAAAVAALGASSAEQLLGERLGEAVDCERARDPQGCGASPGCTTCGALRSMSDCQHGKPQDHDCRLIQFGSGRAMHFRASSRQVVRGQDRYLVVTLADISHEQRRRNLERIFFHDLLNTAGAMSGYLQLLDSVPDDERQQMSQSLLRLVDTLVDEIRSQRDLVLAENGELPVRPREVQSLGVIKDVIGTYRNQPLAEGKFLFVAEGSQSLPLVTDRGLLVRVMGNLVKNAIEASAIGDHVLVGCSTAGNDAVDFWVQNRAAMPRDVQLQLFHRAFTTKGSGRGLGTYSVRLLTTRYLQGTVSFTSSPEAGTRFVVTLPTAPAPATVQLAATTA